MTMTHSLRLLNEGDEAFRERAERTAKYARILVDAALANHCIESFIADPHLPYSEEDQRRNPTVRVEYEEAFAIGGIGECLQATKSKNWGDGPYIHPLRPDDPVDPVRILYVFKENSIYNRRFEQRRSLKRLLGKTHRPLVTNAKRHSKRSFLDDLTSQQAYVIRKLLSVDASTFWRLCRGREFIDLPNEPASVDSTTLDNLPHKPRQLGLPFSQFGKLPD